MKWESVPSKDVNHRSTVDYKNLSGKRANKWTGEALIIRAPLGSLPWCLHEEARVKYSIEWSAS